MSKLRPDQLSRTCGREASVIAWQRALIRAVVALTTDMCSKFIGDVRLLFEVSGKAGGSLMPRRNFS